MLQSPFVHSPSPHRGRLIPLPKQGETPEVWFDPESSISAHDQVRIVARLTHHVDIIEMNDDSYRLGQSRARKADVSV